MIAGMGGSETRALRAIIYEYAYLVAHKRIAAWPVAENQILYHPAAGQVTHNACHDEREGPPPTLLAKIDCRENQQE